MSDEEFAPSEETGIVPMEDENFSLTTSPLTAAERVQELIKALPLLAKRYETLRQICIQHVVNKPSDWALWGTERQGFRPRLNDGAAAKLLSFSGIRMREATTRKEMQTLSDGTQKYIVWHEAKFLSPLGGEFTGLGSCASDDPFVATRYEYDPQQRRKVKITVPQEDVAYDNVVKAARANCLVNGVSALLGLKNVDCDELDSLLSPDAPEGFNFCDSVERVGMTDRKWQPSEKQTKFLEKLGATQAQIDACNNQKDVDDLVNQLKAGKDVRKEIRKEQSEGGMTDNDPARKATLDAINKMANERGIGKSEIDNFRKVCWNVEADTPISNLQATHISRWLNNPVPPEEYAASARAAAAKVSDKKQDSMF